MSHGSKVSHNVKLNEEQKLITEFSKKIVMHVPVKNSFSLVYGHGTLNAPSLV